MGDFVSTSDWYKSAYRRNVIDMHITDWDERFLSQFDPREYVANLVRSQVQSAVVYAHSHVGHCYYPTKVGHMHRGLKGRNILGEVIDLCHRNEINVVVYYSLIVDDWAYRQNPDWRMILGNGKEAAEQGRYGICCPNSPYRDYAVAHAEEICTFFDFEGLRFDMTFWPVVCYCRYCRQRFETEVGGPLPTVIQWEDPNWVSFQRKREEWLAEFGGLATSTVKRLKPQVTVEHNASTHYQDWLWAATYKLAVHSDFCQGDFYGGRLQGSFVRKSFHNLSQNLPYGFETSICINIGNHTAKKPEVLLKAKACASLADGGAFVFIDAIDPIGTLDSAAYARMARVFDETKAYEPYLGGDLCQDVGVYLSLESKFDYSDNGKDLAKAEDPGNRITRRAPHVEAAISVCRSLIDNHVPYGVITQKNLGELSRHRVLVLPNVLVVDDEEVKAFREFVRSGGTLYASGYSSLITKDGVRKADFLLSDVFGVSYVGETKESYSYMAPENDDDHPLCDYSKDYPLALERSQVIVEARPGADVLARIVLPYTDPADPRRYVSIHSNPPGITTDYPAIVVNSYGSGKAMYSTGDLESDDSHRDIFINLIRLQSERFSFEADAPKSVEVTVFRQTDRRRLVISLVNFQEDLPNIPVGGTRVRVRLDGREPERLLLLPEEGEWPFQLHGDYVEFTAPRLETFQMFALDHA